jgi:hypothetical protein
VHPPRRYKQKLVELKKAAEEERLKELEEARNDVTKKGDLTDLCVKPTRSL